jgi:transposase
LWVVTVLMLCVSTVMDVEYRRVEVITGQKRRRDWTAEEKAELLAATMTPGATVTEVARRFDVSRSLLWTWRRKAMAELAAEMGPRFVPLRIEGEAGSTAVVSEPIPPPSERDKPAGPLRLQLGGRGSGWKALSIRRFCVRCWA